MTPAAAARRRSPRGGGEQLREEIVEAVKQLLRETDDIDAVSIRAVAQRVGVTAPSIYLHFADKDALLDAVVSDVFTDLDRAIVKAAAEASTPLGRLLAEGTAYVNFAVQHREHYRVALMQPCVSPPEVDDVLRDSAFMHLHETVAECISAGVFAEGDAYPVALDLWSAAHGIASLLIAKPYISWGDVEQFTRRALSASVLGHVVDGLFDEDDGFTAIATWARERRTSLMNP
jgi:AcrR family transcriptional regulator